MRKILKDISIIIANISKEFFLLYDVDHNSNKDIENLMNIFNDEFIGMLLLSSPCIEVIGDLIEIEKKTNGHI